MENGLAISGGGMKFFAHMGVIKAIEELGIKFDYISGTSSGSVVAFLYSIGISADEMIDIISKRYSEIVEIRVSKVIASAVKSLMKNQLTLNSLIDGSKLENVIAEVLKEKGFKYSTINDVNKNLAIVSCDTISTKEIIFVNKKFGFKNTERTDYLNEAPIPKAIRASMSFPGIFTSCDYDGYNLIDGGTVNNLPSKVLKDMGANKVLGVSFKLNEYEPKDSIMDVALRTADIFSILNMSIAKEYTDATIELEIPDTGLLNISDIKFVYELGYEQTMRQKEKLLQLFS